MLDVQKLISVKYFINPFILTSIIMVEHLIEHLKKNSTTMC